MIKIRSDEATSLVVESLRPRHEGLVIHGYGGAKEEMLGIAVHLAERLDLKLLLFDLPGHGQATEKTLTLENCLSALDSALEALAAPTFFIGHSLGARLGLLRRLPIAVALSPPGKICFEGARRELLTTLRARRVKESSPYAGLREILEDRLLGAEPELAPKILALRAEHDLKSVKDLLEEWEQLGVSVKKIGGADHLDIMTTPATYSEVCRWLNANLE